MLIASKAMMIFDSLSIIYREGSGKITSNVRVLANVWNGLNNNYFMLKGLYNALKINLRIFFTIVCNYMSADQCCQRRCLFYLENYQIDFSGALRRKSEGFIWFNVLEFPGFENFWLAPRHIMYKKLFSLY